MKVIELIEKLKQYPNDLEVRIINAAIEDEEMCPTFSITSVSSLKDADDCSIDLECDDFVFIEMVDNVYIRDDVNIFSVINEHSDLI